MSSKDSLSFVKKVIINTLRYVVSKTPNQEGIIVFIQNYRILPMMKEALKSEDFFEWILFDSQGGSEKGDIFELHSKRIG